MKKILSVLLILVLIFSLVSCDKKVEKKEEKKEEKEIVLAAPRDLAPGKENFHFTSIILFVWEPLISMNEKGEPIPALVKEWKSSEDYKTWTFKLNEGIKFHKGQKLDADIVIKNFDRYKNVGTGKSNFYTFKMDRIFPNLKEYKKVDEYTFQLVFEKPSPTIIYNMTNFSTPIFHPDDFDEKGNFKVELPNATGPFKLVEKKKDQYSVIERNDNYWKEKAKAKRIRVKVMPDSSSRVSALKSEEIMGVLDLGAINPTMAEELIKDKRFQKSVNKSTINHFLSYNGNKEPFNNKEVVKALSLAIDRSVIVKEFYADMTKPTSNLLNYSSPFYKEIKIEHDLNKAREIIKKELKGKKYTLDLIIPEPFTKRYPYKEQAQYIQDVLKVLGFETKIGIYDFPTYKEKRQKGDFNLQMHIHGLPNMEPFTMFDQYMNSKGSTNKAYNLNYKNDEADKLLEELKNTKDMNRRKEIYNKLQDISVKTNPSILLFSDVNLVVSNKLVEGHNATLYGTTLNELRWNK